MFSYLLLFLSIYSYGAAGENFLLTTQYQSVPLLKERVAEVLRPPSEEFTIKDFHRIDASSRIITPLLDIILETTKIAALASLIFKKM